ncbi:MAG: hypothetical protein V1866_06275 [archaeon]
MAIHLRKSRDGLENFDSHDIEEAKRIISEMPGFKFKYGHTYYGPNGQAIGFGIYSRPYHVQTQELNKDFLVRGFARTLRGRA